SITSHINLGLRHILPIYPFLFILGAAALFHYRGRKFFPVVLGIIMAVQIAETAHIYSHYLAFFYGPSGGSANGPRYLLDSNIDWGQDLKKLRTYLEAHNRPSVCVLYYGNGDRDYYGIGHVEYLPRTYEDRSKVDCIGVISATLLYDLYVPVG